MGRRRRKWYVVWEGRNPGVYDNWEDCLDQVHGFARARYRSFDRQEDAVAAYRAGLVGDMELLRALVAGRRHVVNYGAIPGIELDSVAVDAACSVNPGVMEYRGVWVRTGEQIFHQGPFPHATNNIGEFLAIVHALALLNQKGMTATPVYSDSEIARAWVRDKVCRTKLAPSDRNATLLAIVRRAELWLQSNAPANRVIKWDTREWGEIPADFGRK